MIIGHLGAAFGARRLWRDVPMRVLLLATFAPDLLRLGFLPFGMYSWESNIYTHAAPWCLIVAALSAMAAWLDTRSRTAVIAAATLTLSHVVLDVVSGAKLLWVGGPWGLNLDARYWQYEFLIEVGLVVAGWLAMRPVVSGAWRRASVVWLLATVELGALAYGILERPYATRCWAYPFRDCDDSGMLTRRWNIAPPF